MGEESIDAEGGDSVNESPCVEGAGVVWVLGVEVFEKRLISSG